MTPRPKPAGPSREEATFAAWAVRLDSGQLAGRYWFHRDIHPSHEGCIKALFTTRGKAAAAARTSRYLLRTPVRVIVVIRAAAKVRESKR